MGQETPGFDNVGKEYAQLRMRQKRRVTAATAALTNVAPDDAEVLSLDREDNAHDGDGAE